MPKLVEMKPEHINHLARDGWMYNPSTGRTFRANKINVRRVDLQMVDGPVKTSPVVTAASIEEKTEAQKVRPGEEVHIAGQSVEDALDETVQRLKNVTKMAEVKSIAAELGIKLKANQTIAKCKEQVAKHIEKLREFDIGIAG